VQLLADAATRRQRAKSRRLLPTRAAPLEQPGDEHDHEQRDGLDDASAIRCRRSSASSGAPRNVTNKNGDAVFCAWRLSCNCCSRRGGSLLRRLDSVLAARSEATTAV
jgi:hypothetical protein